MSCPLVKILICSSKTVGFQQIKEIAEMLLIEIGFPVQSTMQ